VKYGRKKMTSIDPRLLDHWKKQWTPPKFQTVQEWAEDNLYLPSSASPKPGRYSTDLTPHVREPLKAYTDPETTFVILCWAAQSAKTTTELVCKCFNIANHDGNQIFLMPSETMAKSYSETKLQPIIEATPVLKALKPHQRDKYKKLEMHMQNGVINLIGGASPANLASRSAGRLFTDEIDKLKAELKNEADPLSLLFERAKWFPDKKIFLTSTPTVPEGHIWIWFEKGTQEYYYVPCPDCDHYFTPDWYKDMKWEQDEENEMSLEQRAATAYLQCPDCGFHIKDKHKYKMLEEGKWIAHNKGATKRMRSFHYNEIMSHITKWPDLVLKFLQAVEKKKKGDLSELKNFINSSLSQPWLASAGHTVNDEVIEGMIDIDRPRGTVPNQAKGLVAGVDTQDNGFFYVIRAFGDDNTSWLVTEGFVDTFEALEKAVIQSSFSGMRVSRMFMDCQGHRTDEVYKFCRKWGGAVVPCVGRGKAMTSEYSFFPVDKVPGKQTIGGLMRCVWNTVAVKDLMFTKMRIAHEDPGSFHIHDQTTRAYRQALKSEFKNEKGDYEHIKHIPNHLLDCEALTFLGARILGIEYWEDVKPEERPPTLQSDKQASKPW
jgi:phage terminase large subunit GpA-like protein